MVALVPAVSVPKRNTVCVRVGVRGKVEYGAAIASLEPRDGCVAQNARTVVQHPLFVWAECGQGLLARDAGCFRGVGCYRVCVVCHGTTIKRAAFCPQ